MASTIANLALAAKAGYDPANPMFVHVISFDLKDDYNVAGLLNFSTAVKAAIGIGRTVLGVIDINCKGLRPYYNATTDTLIFRWCDNNSGADGPLIDVPTGDMQTYTGLKLAVLSQ